MIAVLSIDPVPRVRVIALGALAACAVFALPLAAGAQVTNRAQVGVSGRNDTKGYAPSLAIVFASPADYGAGCCLDSDSGEWKGPRYAATKASVSGDSTIDWRAVFTRASASAQAAAKANLVHDWPQAATASLAVPHTVRGAKVGTIPGYLLTTKAPGNGAAQTEVALAFPLCKGLFVVADFSLLAPQQDPDGLGGTFLVNGQSASSWNAAQAAAAVQGVSVDGNLPPGRIVAHASGRRIAGVARDCIGQPLAGLVVHAVPGRATARTSSSGAFSVAVAKAGSYRVTAVLGGVAASSKPVKTR
jgi:hypothetical protein